MQRAANDNVSRSFAYDGLTRASSYAYDDFHRPTAVTYPTGEVITTTYGSPGTPVGLSSSVHGTLVDKVKFDEAGRMTALRFPAGGNLWRAQSFYPWKEPRNGGMLESLKVGLSEDGDERLCPGCARNGFDPALGAVTSPDSMSCQQAAVDRPRRMAFTICADSICRCNLKPGYLSRFQARLGRTREMASGAIRSRVNNKQVADLFRSIGELLQILDESRFVVMAYQNAARTIDGLEQDINQIAADGALEDLPRVGMAIAEKIATFLETGSLPYYDELAAQVPEGVVAMMQTPDVGPKTVRRLWKELGIVSVEALQEAAEQRRLRGLKGFGAKTEERILKSIRLLQSRKDDRTPIGTSLPLAQDLAQGLAQGLREDAAAIRKVEIVGSLRRWRETTGQIRLLAVSDAPEEALRLFESLPQVTEALERGERQSGVLLPAGIQAALRLVEAKDWGAALCCATGNREHLAQVAECAQRAGWRLDADGLTAEGASDGLNGPGKSAFDSEEAFYESVGLPWIPPEIREGGGEVGAALRRELPQLIETRHILGELHGHSTWSDGKASVAEMAEAARRKGYRYWAVTDHSVGLGVTGGVDGEALGAQRREIDAVNERYRAEGVDFSLIQGVEVEVLGDGALGLPDDVLARLDVVVASIHIGLRQEGERVTQRCLNAIDNPWVDVIGHPTGRLLGRRPPSEIDVEAVMQACAASGTAIEINANPARLDLSAEHARRAARLGCRIVVNSDAHGVGQLDLMPFGVHTARRAWLRPTDVMNSRPLDDLLGLLKRNRSGRCAK